MSFTVFNYVVWLCQLSIEFQEWAFYLRIYGRRVSKVIASMTLVIQSNDRCQCFNLELS